MNPFDSSNVQQLTNSTGHTRRSSCPALSSIYDEHASKGRRILARLGLRFVLGLLMVGAILYGLRLKSEDDQDDVAWIFASEVQSEEYVAD